jgi:glycosyltransferase involved in cell wall biosynthesis
MRVLHVVPTYIPAYRYGGPIYSVHGLCRALVNCGVETEVFTTNVDGPNDSDVPLDRPVDLGGVGVSYFPSRRLRRIYWSPRMNLALRERVAEFDVVHLHSVFLWPTLAAGRWALRRGIPYVVAPRGMLVHELFRRRGGLRKRLWVAAFERKTLECSAAVHVTSTLEEEELRAFSFRGIRTAVIPNGVDEASDPVVDPAARDASTLLFLSRINWKKGLDRLLEALARLDGVRLMVAGNDEEGYWPKMEQLMVRLGLDGRVQYLGAVHGERKRDLLRSATALVLPSYSENFGNVVLEAMAQGCPVVVTPEVGLAADVERWGAGIVADGEPGQLAEGIRAVLGDPDLREAMGRAGVVAVRERFSWGAVGRRMVGLYEEVLRVKG